MAHPFLFYNYLDFVTLRGQSSRLGWEFYYPGYNTVKLTTLVMSKLDSINLTQPTRKYDKVKL